MRDRGDVQEHADMLTNAHRIERARTRQRSTSPILAVHGWHSRCPGSPVHGSMTISAVIGDNA